MTVDRPLPGDVVADAIDQPFWDGCRDGAFLVYRCVRCERTVWPAGACPDHGFGSMSWVESTGRGRLHTWTVIHQRYSASFDGAPPVPAVVQLDDGPLFHTAIVDHDGVALRAGMEVDLALTVVADDLTIPYFRPRRPV